MGGEARGLGMAKLPHGLPYLQPVLQTVVLEVGLLEDVADRREQIDEQLQVMIVRQVSWRIQVTEVTWTYRYGWNGEGVVEVGGVVGSFLEIGVGTFFRCVEQDPMEGVEEFHFYRTGA